ncbi:MAG: hypothetical protein ACHQ6T_01480 [Myxococcota bacterium]
MRRGLVTRLVVAAVTLLCGCTLTKRPEIEEPEHSAPLQGDRAAVWRIGVQEPALRTGPDQPKVALEEIRESARVIGALRGSGLFYEIDFTRQLHCPIDFEVVALRRSAPEFETWPTWLDVLTLSFRGDSHRNVSFQPAGAPDERIDLQYETGLWVGVTPTVLWPLAFFGWLGDWSTEDIGGDELQAFRRQLLARGGALAAHVGETPARCQEKPDEQGEPLR